MSYWRGTFICLLALSFVNPAFSQAGGSTRGTPGKTYPDFALQPPPINTSPGPEYASWTRLYQEVPGVERTAKGRLWAVWTAGGEDEGPWSYVVLVTSGDDGTTWSEPKLVIDPPGNILAWETDLWRDPLGHLWLFWAQGYGRWDGRDGVWAIVSDDPDSENPKWSTPRRLADGTAKNKPTVLTTGEWLLPVDVFSGCDLPAVNQYFKLGLSPSVIKALCHDSGEMKGINVYRSVDEGKTWTWLGQVHPGDLSPLESMIVERHDRSLWMLIRTRYGIGQSISRDRGKTWEQISESGISHPTTRFFIRRLQSGRLLMVRHNPPDKKMRSHLTAYLSDDDGKSWYGNLLLDERALVSYPDGVEAENGKIYVVYDRGRHSDLEILMATFTQEDVKQGKCITNQCQLKMIVNKAGEFRPGEFN